MPYKFNPFTKKMDYYKDFVSIPGAGISVDGAITGQIEFYTTPTGNITRTLPLAADNIGKVYYLKKLDDSDYYVTIAPQIGETIDGDDYYRLELEDEFVQLVGKDSTSWAVFAE